MLYSMAPGRRIGPARAATLAHALGKVHRTVNPVRRTGIDAGVPDMGEIVRIATFEGDGDFPAYVARPEPAAANGAAIIVIQEIFGVNAGIREKCDHWAALGFLA